MEAEYPRFPDATPCSGYVIFINPLELRYSMGPNPSSTRCIDERFLLEFLEAQLLSSICPMNRIVCPEQLALTQNLL